MTTGMRVFLIIGSVLSCAYVLRKIRKSKMKTENSLFWIFFSGILVLLGLFPGIADWFAGLLGVRMKGVTKELFLKEMIYELTYCVLKVLQNTGRGSQVYHCICVTQ